MVRYQTALHSDTEKFSGGRSYSGEGGAPQGEIWTRLQILDLPQNGVASRVLADYVHATPIGASPSGKAAVFGTAIPRFESWRPSQAFCRGEKQVISGASIRARPAGSTVGSTEREGLS